MIKNCVVDFVGYFDGKKLQIFGKKGGGTLIRNNLLPVLVTPEKDQHCFPKQRGWGGGEGLRGCLEVFFSSPNFHPNYRR